MNKLLLLTIFVGVFSSCSKDYSKLSFLDKYKPNQLIGSQRLPAQVDGNSCFVDEFEISRIKSDISILEKKYEKSVKVPKEFRFTDFKPAETHYISRYHEYMYLGEESKSCKDLPCILNSAYGKEGIEQGYRIYHWFLTMGSGISTLNKIPRYDTDKTKKRIEYLFPNKELKLLNMTSEIISKDYRNIKISMLHRFPNGTSPGLLVAGQYSYTYSTVKKWDGTIFLTNQSVSVSERTNKINGYYIHTLVHELSHALDFTFGKKKTSDHFSAYDKWINLSWVWGESKVTKTKVENGVEVKYETVEMDWIVDEEKAKKEGFVRGYQRTSHKEDFADSGANFLIDAEKMQRISPKKLKVFQESFYNDKTFLKNDEVKYIQDYLVEDFSDNFWDILKECTLEDSGFYSNVGYSFPVSVQMLPQDQGRCVKKKSVELFTRKLNSFRKTRYYACSQSKGKDQEIIQKAITSTGKKIEEQISELGGLESIKKQWGEFRRLLKNSCDPIVVYLKNRKSRDAETRYLNELENCSNDTLAEFGATHEIFNDEVSSYVEANTFTKAKSLAKESFENMTKGIDTTFANGAQRLVSACSKFREEELNSSSPISGGNVFVQASVLNCVNDQFQSSYDDVIRDYLENKYNLSELGLEYITQMYYSKYVSSVNKYFVELNEKEILSYSKHIFDNASVIFNNELNDEQILISYFREKSLKDFKNALKERLLRYIPSQIGSIPTTISIDELKNQLSKKLEKTLEVNAQNRAVNEVRQVDRFILNKKNSVYSESLNSINWKETQLNQSNFSQFCSKKVKTFSANVNVDLDPKYYTVDLIKSKLVVAVCDLHLSEFKKEIREVDLEIKSRTTRLDRNNDVEYDWKLKLDGELVAKKCTENMSKLVKSVLGQSKYMDYRKSYIKHQSDFCKSSLKDWEKEVQKVSAYLDCKKQCQVSKIAESRLTSAQWKGYLDAFSLKVTSSLEAIVKNDLSKEISSCKEKYPKPRYSLMRLKRKKCLEAITFDSLMGKQVSFKKLYEELLKKELSVFKSEISKHMK